MRIRENRPIPAKARFGRTVTIWSYARGAPSAAVAYEAASSRSRERVARSRGRSAPLRSARGNRKGIPIQGRATKRGPAQRAILRASNHRPGDPPLQESPRASGPGDRRGSQVDVHIL